VFYADEKTVACIRKKQKKRELESPIARSQKQKRRREGKNQFAMECRKPIAPTRNGLMKWSAPVSVSPLSKIVVSLKIVVLHKVSLGVQTGERGLPIVNQQRILGRGRTERLGMRAERFTQQSGRS
jgi:hypothetical protein